jgi:RNA-binding protein
MTPKERARLRGLANGIETVLQIGKEGIGDSLIHQADITLEARELIKGRVLDGCMDYTPRTAAEALAQATNSEVVQVIGSKFVLYRQKKAAEKERKAEKPRPNSRKKRMERRGAPDDSDRKPRRERFDRAGQRNAVGKFGGRKPPRADSFGNRGGRGEPSQADSFGKRDGRREPSRADSDGRRTAAPSGRAGQPKGGAYGQRGARQPGSRPGQRNAFGKPPAQRKAARPGNALSARRGAGGTPPARRNAAKPGQARRNVRRK